jgi:hypothetical protein
MALQMGYINRPVDWLQYALKIRAYTNFLIKLWIFENWERATEKVQRLLDSALIAFLMDLLMK